MRVRGRSVGDAQVVDVELEDGLIRSVTAAAGTPDLGDETCVVSPGWIDLQVNGYRGIDLNGSFRAGAPAIDYSVVEDLAAVIPESGASRFLPTVTTNTPDALRTALKAIADAIERSPGLAARMPGVHLEGPFISPEDGPRGAHPAEAVTNPDWSLFQRLQEAARGRIRLLTLAPERPGALRLIERVVESGVTVSLGHCAPTGEQVRDAVQAGASMSTHLGNGAHAELPRHPNYLWDQLADDRLTAGVIADLHHLPASVLTCIARVKGAGRLVVVSDIVSLGGLPAGQYNQGRHEVLPNGRVNLAGTPYLAGAGHLLNVGVANLRRVTGWREESVIGTVTSVAAEAVGLRAPRVAVGEPADLTLFRWPEGDGPAEVVATICSGQVLYRA